VVDASLVLSSWATPSLRTGRLLASVGPPDGWGLPAVGQNGRLVDAVHHRGGADEAALFRTLGVAGALGGEEE
jgi:hypothetical protein